MTAADSEWPTAAWPRVRASLPAPPARVVEIGCGPQGGFVPALLADGYHAVGVDPAAPEGDAYLRATFEDAAVDGTVDAVVISMALHHVDDLGAVLDHVAEVMAPGGTLVVLEWGWERFDERAARWCFDRLPPPAPGEDPSWLRRYHDAWIESGRPWPDYMQAWATTENLHSSLDMHHELNRRFTPSALVDIPYFAPDLTNTTFPDEQTALATTDLPPTAFHYVAHLP